uniref:Uncharacterized protein n=1 Tax=Streptomyces sp. NBC_00003 TaxID=2903608 RepID=A0AAU2V8T8_9ACTN
MIKKVNLSSVLAVAIRVSARRIAESFSGVIDGRCPELEFRPPLFPCPAVRRSSPMVPRRWLGG